jgi:homoserine acetyltransferase
MASAAPRGEHHAITSRHGHDGFLIETEQIGAILRHVAANPAGTGEIR